MGNALDAAKFSVEQGNTGVGTRKTLLEAVDTGMADVNTWATNIATERKKLKDDTAKLYREGELKAQQEISKLTSTGEQYKTERDLVIMGLASYKDQLYNNEKLVKNGFISADDNIIFRENGKQTFDIMQQKIQSASKDLQLTLQRAKGGYWPDEEGGPDVYHLPVSGDEEGAMQRIQSRIMNPNFVNMSIGRNGFGNVTLYQTKLQDGVEVLDLDEKGNPKILPGQGSEMSILALDGGRNERADRFDLATETKKFFVKDGALDVAFQTMATGPDGKMYGTVKDFLLAKDSNGNLINKKVTTLVNDATALATSTNSRQVSILTDNGPEGERSQTKTMNEWAMLTDKEKNEKIKYNYYDLEKGEVVEGEKNKYLEMKLVANQLTVVLRPEDVKAAANSAKGSILSKVNEKYTMGGTKRSESKPSSVDIALGDREKKGKYYAELIDTGATGNKSSINAIVTQSKILKEAVYSRDKNNNLILNFINVDGEKLSDIPLTGAKATGAGSQIASQAQLTENAAQNYLEYTSFKGDKANTKAVGIENYRYSQVKEGRPYVFMDDIALSYDNNANPLTPSTAFANAGEDSKKIKIAFDQTVSKMVEIYGFPEGFITVEISDKGGLNDRMKVFGHLNGKKKQLLDTENDEDNGRLVKNALEQYAKENNPRKKEETTAKPSFQDWKLIKGNENKTYKDWQNS
jgi:hypothetical protein